MPANERNERPSGPFKTRLSRVETGPKRRKDATDGAKALNELLITNKTRETVQLGSLSRTTDFLRVHCHGKCHCNMVFFYFGVTKFSFSHLSKF